MLTPDQCTRILIQFVVHPKEEFYEYCGLHDLVHAALEGYPVTVFAFGQTGSGKSHTIIGSRLGRKKKNPGVISPDDGVLPRAVFQSFDAIGARSADADVQV